MEAQIARMISNMSLEELNDKGILEPAREKVCC